MKRGLDWYPREQRAILDSIRAARMTDRQAAIYNIVIDLIYDGAGETPDDPRHIASYLSNVGQAAARATIQQLVDMGKLTRIGDMLHQKRAENVAKTRQNLRETRAEAGRLGGISSGKMRRADNENKTFTEASASSKDEAEKRREEKKEGGGGSAPAREADPTDRELILAAIGVDPVSGLTGRGGTRLGTQADMAHLALWLRMPGLTMPVICQQIRDDMAKKRDGPPGSFKYFDQSMQRLSGTLSQAPLDPITTPQRTGAGNERQKFDRAIHDLADRLNQGTVSIDNSSRDPFAKRAG
jgi:hypothetical protein